MIYSDAPVAAFVVIPLLLVAALMRGTFVATLRGGASRQASNRAALIAGAASLLWMSVTWVVAQAGVLRAWDRTPPPFALLVVSILALAASIAWGGLGRRLAEFIPLWALVGVQAFRLPLELAMHQMSERGVMPHVMTYTGRNLDIVTGATAIFVSALVWSGRGGRRLVALWNVVGVLLLINVVTIALLATPRVRYFGEDELNTWVADPPFVWLPAVMVLAALAGHLIIFRALQRSRDSATRTR